MKLIWSYVADIEVQTAASGYGIIVTPAKQCVMEIIGINIRGGTLNRKWWIYQDLIDGPYFEIFRNLPNADSVGKGISYPCDDYLERFTGYKGDLIISNPDELNIYTSENGTVGEHAIITIRAKLSNYFLPAVRLYSVVNNKINTLHQNKIIGVLE